jgi:glycerophosphoryl diester phosphodiesterase
MLPPMLQYCLIIAHKGYSARYPESTLVCYEAAVSAGADVLELDVRTTRDGALVIKHERTMSDLTGLPGNVDDYTLADLQALDFGAPFDPRFAGSRILTLDELLDFAQPLSVGLCIELKDVESGDRPGYGEDIVAQLRRRNLLHRAVINSGCVACLQRLRAAEPAVRLAVDVPIDHQAPAPDFATLAADLAASGAHIAEYHHRYLTPEMVRDCRRIGYPVWAWTVNQRSDMLRLLEWGVDGILTDDPALLRAVAGR